MRDRVTQIKRAIALMLAILMVVTGLPQTAYTVYGAEPDSGEIDLTLEPEAAEPEIAEPEVNDAAIVEEEEIVYEGEELEIEETESAIESETAESEEADVEETEIAELEVEGDDPVVIFDANGGTMSVLDNNAIDSTGEEGAYTTQTFNYGGTETEIYVDLQDLDSIKPVKEGSLFVGWYDSEDGSQPYEITEKKTRTYKAKWSNPVTFDANGGKFTTLDVDHVIEYTGEEGAWLTQTFAYWERDDGTLIYSIRSLDDLKPVREDFTFIGWFDENGNTPWPVTGEARTFKAKWARNLGDAPSLDSIYGSNGLNLFTAGNKVRFSMKVNKDDYAVILNSLDEEKEVLRIYYQYAAQKPVHGGSSTPDADGYYSRWNTQLINKDDYTEFPGEAFDAYDYDYLFDGIPTEAVPVRFRLAYVIVEKDDEGSWIKWEDWSNIVGESDYITVNATYVPAATSVALKDKNVLKPVKFGPELTSEITLNKGADINNLSIKYVYDGEPYDSKPDFLDKLEISDGKLKVKAADTAQAGKSVDIIFYNKKMYDAHGNLVPWNQQKITGNKYTITVQNPTWISKTPTATLTSASDVALTFKVGAPSGESFADGNYYVGVGLVKNNNTEKGLKEGLVIDDVHEEFFKINEDGTIPEITINPFLDKEDGTKVTELGKGCGTSMNAIFCIVMTDGNAPDKGGKVLAITDVKKCKTITAATKAPYYADKITLKKVNANLYAGDCDVIVATVDFGKNATYTRQSDWELDPIANQDLSNIGIYATQGEYNIKVTVSDDAKPGTYAIYARTTAYYENNGVPATASISIKVLPTASSISVEPVSIYHKPGSAASFTVKPTVTDQTGAVIKNAAFDVKIGEVVAGKLTEVPGLSYNKGKIKVDKTFSADPNKQYAIRVLGKCGKEIETGYENIMIVEEKIKLQKFDFPVAGAQRSIEDTMTLDQYNNLGWSGDIDDFGETLGVNDITGCGIVIKDEQGNPVPATLLKDAKVPNPRYIKKAGKITLSATAIDGTKLSRTVNIVSTTSAAMTFSKLHLKGSVDEYEMENGVFDVSGESTGTVYSLWLSDLNIPSINSLTDISGNKLTLKGAKVINNYHNDYLTFIMTGSTTTITLSVGKTKGTYTIKNTTFDEKAPKLTPEKKKLYAGFVPGYADCQTLNFKFDKLMPTGFSIEADSTNKDIKEYFDNGMISFAPIHLDEIQVMIDPCASSELKAGSYPVTLELNSGSGYLCRTIKLTLKLENLKKNYKLKNKYTMSEKDATAVLLEGSGSGVKKIENVIIYNDNIKGKYNNFNEYFEIDMVWDADNSCWLYEIRLKDGVELNDVKSITGYVGYILSYIDGNSEVRLEKITVNISKSQVYKYKADSPEVALADKANPIENIAIYGNNNQMEIVKAAALDAKTADLLATDEGLKIENGKLTVKLNPDKITKAGKITLKVNAIPSTSAYKDDDSVTAEHSIPVSITITFTK